MGEEAALGYVLTYQELYQWLRAQGFTFPGYAEEKLPPETDDSIDIVSHARRYLRSKGQLRLADCLLRVNEKDYKGRIEDKVAFPMCKQTREGECEETSTAIRVKAKLFGKDEKEWSSIPFKAIRLHDKRVLRSGQNVDEEDGILSDYSESGKLRKFKVLPLDDATKVIMDGLEEARLAREARMEGSDGFPPSNHTRARRRRIPIRTRPL